MNERLYQPLSHEDEPANDLSNRHDNAAKDRLPKKEILLGTALLSIGLTFFYLCYLHHKGHTKEHIKEGSGWGLITIGLLTFLPGAYCTWVTFAAWAGLMGYKYTDIPKVD